MYGRRYLDRFLIDGSRFGAGRVRMVKKPRSISLFAGFLLALATNFAFAVGLGVLQVESQPGEPLRARVALIDLGDVGPAELQVELASVADYRQANVTRYEILSALRLHIETGPTGPWLVLTTDQPIAESSSTIILDMTWPGGRILSQHLLTVGAASPPEIVPPAPVSEPAPAAGGELAEAGRQTIRTVSGDSLWRIAERLAGEDSVILRQTMLALHRLNPEAFVDGNINRLRADADLRVPDLTDAGALDQSTAQDETVRQSVAANTQPQPLAPPAPQATGQDDDPDGQLSLVVDNSEEEDQGGGELDQRISELEDQLALTLEEVDRVRIEQEELRSRLDDLDVQISMATQIIELQQQELAELQASLAAESEEQARLEAEQAAAAEAEAVAAEAAAAEALAAPDFPESLLENPVYLAIGAAILVLALVLLLMLRSSRQDEGEEDDEPFVILGGEGASDDEQSDEDSDFEEPGEMDERAGEPFDEPGEEAETEPGEEPAAEEPEDERSQEAETGEEAGDADAEDPDDRDDFTIALDQAGEEEVAEQLNLAYSFHKMGETDKSRKILENVIRSGNEAQISEARQLLAIIDDLS